MIALLALAAALADGPGLRDFCADRPGKDTPTCILDAGHLQVETGLADVTRQHDASATDRQYGFGDTLIRYGLTERLEVQLALPGHVTDRSRDRATGALSRVAGFGDIGASLRFSLVHPDGSGTAVAIEPFVTAPTGKAGIGADGWTGGVIAPLAFDLGGGWALVADPEVDIDPNSLKGGAHAAWTGLVGLSHDIARGLSLGGEVWAMRDADPGAKTTQASVDLTLSWMPREHGNLQFDAGANFGLTHETPDNELYVGVAERF